MEPAENTPTLAVIIPVYNEARTVAEVIRRVYATGLSLQVVVVDDNSTDGTDELLEKLKATQYPGLLLVRHTKNLGKGAAISSGLEIVTSPVVVIQDADLEYHPVNYPLALHLITDEGADAVYGSRFLGPHRVFMFWHLVANKVLTLLVNLACDATLNDMETGFKMFRTEVFRALDVQSQKFDFEVEVTMKLFRRRSRVYEIPITYTGRTYAEGKKITWKDGFHALWAILYWTVRAR